MILTRLATALGAGAIPLLDLAANQQALSHDLTNALRPDFAKYGRDSASGREPLPAARGGSGSRCAHEDGHDRRSSRLWPVPGGGVAGEGGRQPWRRGRGGPWGRRRGGARSADRAHARAHALGCGAAGTACTSAPAFRRPATRSAEALVSRLWRHGTRANRGKRARGRSPGGASHARYPRLARRPLRLGARGPRAGGRLCPGPEPALARRSLTPPSLEARRRRANGSPGSPVPPAGRSSPTRRARVPSAAPSAGRSRRSSPRSSGRGSSAPTV